MITCFFCQTLLSDFLEDVLPSSRKAEIKKHLDDCKKCTAVQQDLVASIEILGAIPGVPLSHELALQITETAMEGSGRWLRPRNVLQAGAGLAVCAALVAGVLGLFPSMFSWLNPQTDSSQLARYYPLQHGASEIVDEHAGWLQIRDTSMRSVWEEGGISPEEFEKSFQPRGLASDAPGAEEEDTE